MFAEVGIGGVGGAVLDGLGIGQVAVGTLSGGGSGEETHLEGTSGLMLGNGNLGQFLGHSLGGTRGGETAQSEIFSIFYQCCSFGSSHACISHYDKI